MQAKWSNRIYYLAVLPYKSMHGHEYYSFTSLIKNMASCDQCGETGNTLYYCDILVSTKKFLCENCHPDY